MKVVLKSIIKENELRFELPTDETRFTIEKLVRDCIKNNAGYMSLEIRKPYKSRSLNQNSMIWAMIQQIAEEIGEDVDEVERLAKMKALTKGYPSRISKITGRPIPESMTKIDTEQAGYLIESLQEMASFCGVVLHDINNIRLTNDR